MFTTVPTEAIDDLIDTISELRGVLQLFTDRLDALDRGVAAMLAHERQSELSRSAQPNVVMEETGG